MATSNQAPPSFTGNSGSAASGASGPSTGYQGANDAPGSNTGTPATPATPASGPQGPNAAGLNPGPITTASIPAPGAGYGVAGFQKIASQTVISGNEPANMAGAKPAVAAKPYDEKQLVQSLADSLDVKAPKGESLEAAVVNKLADKYGVKISQRGMTTAGTGTGQGEAGQIRHNIASWFDTVVGGAASSIGQTLPQIQNREASDAARAQALKIKSPVLRAQAIRKLDRQDQEAQSHGTAPGTAEPVPVESTKALNQIIGQVAQKLGVQGAGPNALEDIARHTGVPYESPAAVAQAGTPQTYAQNFQSFAAQWQKNEKLSNGVTFQQQWIDNLENMGELNADINTGAASQAISKTGAITTTTPKINQNEVFNAYQNFLLASQQANQSPLQYMQAAPQSAASQALTQGAPSEMYAYVQGVAQEMGVGLTSSQINQISNFYGASATTADDPSSVEDQIKDAVVDLYSPPSDPTNPNSPNAYGVVNPSGVANTMYIDIQQQALAYQVPISAQQITSMVQSDLQGATVESLYVAADAAEAKAQQTFEDQAKGLYPSLAAQISQGSTVQQLTAPYLNVAEAITGVPASTMTTDLTSGGVSKWAAFLQGGTNPSGSTQGQNTTATAQAGQPQMMTLDQWKTYLMQNPQYGFQNTQGAKDMAEQLSSAILNEFGRVNTTESQTPVQSLYQGQSDLSANTS